MCRHYCQSCLPSGPDHDRKIYRIHAIYARGSHGIFNIRRCAVDSGNSHVGVWIRSLMLDIGTKTGVVSVSQKQSSTIIGVGSIKGRFPTGARRKIRLRPMRATRQSPEASGWAVHVSWADAGSPTDSTLEKHACEACAFCIPLKHHTQKAPRRLGCR